MRRELPRCEMEIGGKRVEYRIRRNPRARRVLLKMQDDLGLVVVLPRWFAASGVPGVLLENRAWVLRALAKRDADIAAHAPEPGGVRTILYQGRRIPLRSLLEPHRSPPLLLLSGGEFLLHAAPPGPDAEAFESLLHRWYRARAQALFPQKVALWAARTGLRPRTLRIGDLKTRWGSCSSLGTVSLSWRLLLAPEEVLDYLVVHELCHLRRPDHSASFWNLVGAYLPDYNRPRNWLRHHGAALRTPTC